MITYPCIKLVDTLIQLDLARQNETEKVQPKKITLVTVVKNGETYIKRSIESVLRQKTDIPIEYIIFDAMSDDGTEAIIKEYINDKRIQYFREKDSGPSDALNKAF